MESRDAMKQGPGTRPMAEGKRLATVLDYMTAVPQTIGRDQSLATARRMMLDNHCRHLPVLHGGRLVGILSDRDVGLLEAFEKVELEQATVGDAMTPEPYVVAPHASLAEVARAMAERKLGSVLVVDHGRVEGVFTTTDACRALAELLGGREGGP